METASKFSWVAKEPASEINTYMTIPTFQSVNTGTSPNKGDGDSLRTAFNKINANFSTLTSYLTTLTGSTSTATSAANLGDIVITNATFSTALTNEDITFNPNGNGKVRFANTPIQFDNGSNGSPVTPAKMLVYTKGGTGLVGLGLDNTNNSIRVAGDNVLLGTILDVGYYTVGSGAWNSKFYINYQGNIQSGGSVTATGVVTALGGYKFADGSVQTTAVYSATVATTTTVGLVKIGTNLTISPDGTLNAQAGGGGGGSISVSGITAGNTITNLVTNVTALRFDEDSGFAVTNLGSGAAKIAMNSTFKYWEVDGQQTLIAEGLDHIHIIAGAGMRIGTNPSSNPKSITFTATVTTSTLATSSTVGLIKAGFGVNISASGSLTVNTATNARSLGDLLVNSTTVYPNTGTKFFGMGNSDISQGTSGVTYISIPALSDVATDFTLSTPNQFVLTTARSPNSGGGNIVISPNVDGYGPNYVAMGVSSSTNTAGMFLFGPQGEIDFWPNKTIANLYTGGQGGVIDITTKNNNDIGLRPNGTGTVKISSSVSIGKFIINSTSAPGTGGGGVNSGNYLTDAVALDANKTIQKLSNGDYYLPPGQEGQIVYFVPTTGTQGGTNVTVWFKRQRNMFSGTAAEYANSGWYVFYGYDVTASVNSAKGPTYAIYTDGAWNPSTGNVV